MKMKQWIVLPLVALFALGGVIVASADYTVKDAGGTTQTILAFVCATTKICPAHVVINSSGTEILTSSNPGRFDPTGTTTQPVSAASLPLPTGAATAANQTSIISQLTSLNSAATSPAPAGTNIIGKVGIDQTTDGTTNAVRLSTEYPAGAAASYGSTTGTTAATATTLAATASKTQYVCGFSIRANATAAATGNATLSDGTKTFNFTQWTAPLASGVGVIEQEFRPCRPATAANTAWTLTSAAPGSGGTVSVAIWGYVQ